jgi:phage-related protein
MTIEQYWDSGYAEGDIVEITASASISSFSSRVGSPIPSISILASGGTGSGYRYFANRLPYGLSINSGGVISGSPIIADSGIADIVVVDSANNSSNIVQISYQILISTELTKNFSWLPISASESSKPKAYNAPFGDGYEQNSPKGINSNPQTWLLQFSGSNETINEIDDFLDSLKGCLKFTWQSPSSNTTLLWLCKEWQKKPSVGGVATLTATFNQQFGV